jgi:hypothetical protein
MGPKDMTNPPSRHTFSLRNASPHETLFIGFAHGVGIKKAQSLARLSGWEFNHPVADLLTVVDRLNRDCIIIEAARL